MDTKNLLEIRNLNVDFKTPRGRVHALREVSFNAPKGKIVGIVGESGSGKSTVIWAMTQLLAGNGVVEGGEIFFNGRNVLDFSEDELRAFRGEEASIVFQDPMTSQIPVLSYSQQMSDIAYRQRNKSFREKIEHSKQIMRKVGIPDTEQRVYQYPHQFSGGMRQRAGIAMALLMNPLMLIGDEPTTALDVTMEAQIIHLLRSLQEELKSTVMIVSHNLGLIAELCDEVVVMYAGEVVEQGDIRQIFHNAKHPYTQALLECDPARVSNRARFLPTIPGDLPDLHIQPNGCVFAPRCKYALQRCEQDRPETYLIEGTHNTKCHLLDSSRDQFGTSSTIERQVSKTETYDSSLKNIIDFDNCPLIGHSINYAKKSNLIDEIYVSTDCKEIENVSNQFDVSVITRPENIAKDDSSTELTIEHVIKSQNIDSNSIIVLLQPTSPIRPKGALDQMLRDLVKHNYDSMDIYERAAG